VGAAVTDDDRPQPSRETFVKAARLLDHKIFKVDEYRGCYERYDNTMSDEQELLVFERGDSVAALLFDPSHREVILVEQFRLPTRANGNGRGWILETAAGMIRAGETARASMIRELKEETGYQVTDLAPIATFFVSPGGSSERIFLFYAEVRRTEQKYSGGGEISEGENIKIVRMPISQFFAKLRNQEFEDAKLIIAGQWLRDRHATLPIQDETAAVPEEFEVISPRNGGKNSRVKRIIGYMGGDILKVHSVQVWVNPVNTDMMLDRFTDRTVSAVIRTAAAEKFSNTKRVKRDTLGEELRSAMGNRNFVKPAKVIDTGSGELKRTHKVERIFHVATMKGEIGEEVNADLETVGLCVDNVLAAVERARRYESVLFPMLATGEDGLPINQIAPLLIHRAVKFFRENPRARLTKIYFLAYSEIDKDVVADVVEQLAQKGVLEQIRKS
jgi:nudix-type nucleoside diphosphatase (YffH/AdpP family)